MLWTLMCLRVPRNFLQRQNRLKARNKKRSRQSIPPRPIIPFGHAAAYAYPTYYRLRMNLQVKNHVPPLRYQLQQRPEETEEIWQPLRINLEPFRLLRLHSTFIPYPNINLHILRSCSLHNLMASCRQWFRWRRSLPPTDRYISARPCHLLHRLQRLHRSHTEHLSPMLHQVASWFREARPIPHIRLVSISRHNRNINPSLLRHSILEAP